MRLGEVRVRGERPREPVLLHQLLELQLLCGLRRGGGGAVGRMGLDLVLEVVLQLLQPPAYHLLIVCVCGFDRLRLGGGQFSSILAYRFRTFRYTRMNDSTRHRFDSVP